MISITITSYFRDAKIGGKMEISNENKKTIIMRAYEPHGSLLASNAASFPGNTLPVQ
jgi:hypothetical protein